MNNTAKKIEIFVIVVIISLIGIIYAFTRTPAPATVNELSQNQNDTVQPSPTPSPTQLVPTSTVEYAGQDGKNALELLQALHKVDVAHYSFGDLVTGINGLAPDANHFWAMYVNGEFSQVGASAYVTKSTDKIKWQIDEIVP